MTGRAQPATRPVETEMDGDEPFPYTIAANQHGKICVPHSSSYTYTSKAILAGRVHEPATIEYIVNNHRDLDIVHAGAGFGDFLPALSRACTGTIFTFEPNRENYYCAQKTIEINGLDNVVLSELGLGDGTSSAGIRVSDKGVPLGPRSEISEIIGGAGVQPCEIAKLDDVLPHQRVSIIHLDTEGYEFHILNGAKALIERCRPTIILEIDERALKYNDYMENIGYRPVEQLIYNAGEMVFVNTVYQHR